MSTEIRMRIRRDENGTLVSERFNLKASSKDRQEAITENERWLSERSDYLSKTLGMSDEEIKRFNLDQRVEDGLKNRDPEIMASIRPFVYIVRSRNPEATYETAAREAKSILVNFMYQERFD